MARNVIHIFGPSGSGTTSLGRMLCREPGFFLMDTDDYFWLPTNPPFTAKRPISERLALMERDIALHENVVISGSLTDWGDPLIPFFTLAVRLEMDPALRLERITQRERQRFGSRIHPGGGTAQPGQARPMADSAPLPAFAAGRCRPAGGEFSKNSPAAQMKGDIHDHRFSPRTGTDRRQLD